MGGVGGQCKDCKICWPQTRADPPPQASSPTSEVLCGGSTALTAWGERSKGRRVRLLPPSLGFGSFHPTTVPPELLQT